MWAFFDKMINRFLSARAEVTVRRGFLADLVQVLVDLTGLRVEACQNLGVLERVIESKKRVFQLVVLSQEVIFGYEHVFRVRDGYRGAGSEQSA